MKYIKINDYNCKTCDSKEYDVLMNDNGEVELIVCSDCGSVYTGKYEVIEE